MKEMSFLPVDVLILIPFKERLLKKLRFYKFLTHIEFSHAKFSY